MKRGSSPDLRDSQSETAAKILDVAALADRLVHAGSNDVYRQVHAEVDRILLRRILDHFEDNQVLASQSLGISRTTLRSKVALLEVERGENRSRASR